MTTVLEATALNRIEAAGFPTPAPQVRFAEGRKFAFDWGWPDHKIALELEGGVFQNGWHQSVQRYRTDCEKYSLAAILGWKVIRVTTDMVSDGRMITWLRWAFTGTYEPPPKTTRKKLPRQDQVPILPAGKKQRQPHQPPGGKASGGLQVQQLRKLPPRTSPRRN